VHFCGSAGVSHVMFTMVKASEVFPLRAPLCDREGLTEGHPLVPGESVLFLGEIWGGGVVSLTNFRLYCHLNDHGFSFINIPLGLIDVVELRDLFFIHVYCKDARSYRIQFTTNTSAEEWTRRIQDEISPPVKIEDVFAFAHFAWALETGFEELRGVADLSESARDNEFSWFRSELARLRFDLQGAWRVSVANNEHRLCPTYPAELLLPASISDSVLEKVAQFRAARRIPAIVWRNTANGAVLARCSQPEVGWLGWRSSEDEELVRALAEACAYDSGTGSSAYSNSGSDVSSYCVSDSGCSEPIPLGNVNGNARHHSGEIPSLKDLSAEAAARGEMKKVLIIDARSYTAAVGNRARGGGVECPEYYHNAEILFMNLANIHSIRKSFQALRTLCQAPPDQTSWFQGLDSTKWLHHMAGLLKAAVRSATALQTEGRPVIVHCSDGWDRTPQIVSLSQLLLDPYYRTLEGFQVLVEKEWLDFGHKMADRCGQGLGCSDINERSPIFLQWLDCVHQLLLQFPCHFEFNLTFLIKLAEHTYSNLFGNFLANNLQERKKLRIKERTRSIWGYLRSHPSKFRNFLFVRREEVLWPRYEVRDLLLWQDVYAGEGVGVGASLGQGSLSLSLPPRSASGGSSSSNSEQSTDSEQGDQLTPSESHAADLTGTDKLQNGTSKESTPELCPSFPRKSSVSSEEGECMSPGLPPLARAPPLPSPPVTGCETSTDTLVPHTNTTTRQEQELLHKSSSSAVTASSNLCDPLDSDGLVAHNNQVQRRMVEIFSVHSAEVLALRRDLHSYRLALSQAGIRADSGVGSSQGRGQGDIEQDELALMEGRSGVESTTSEVSWEAVDEKETRPTLWVPDHAASQCMGCHTQFWFGRRKHHCRSCGRLFCSECSEQSIPIPAEQLYQPVRVCDQCFQVLANCQEGEGPGVEHSCTIKQGAVSLAKEAIEDSEEPSEGKDEVTLVHDMEDSIEKKLAASCTVSDSSAVQTDRGAVCCKELEKEENAGSNKGVEVEVN